MSDDTAPAPQEPADAEATESAQATESAEAAAPDAAEPTDGAAGEPEGAGDGIDLADVIDLQPTPPTREEELEAQLAELQARLRTVSAAYQKQTEEVEQVRKRLERQAAIKEEMRRGEVVVALFDPVQNLKRSIEAAAKGATMDDTIGGLKMVQSQFMDAFTKLGLEEVPGVGARFDPNTHEALTTIPVTDPAMDDVVVEVFSAGFRIGSRLIAPARVVVGRLAEPAGEA